RERDVRRLLLLMLMLMLLLLLLVQFGLSPSMKGSPRFHPLLRYFGISLSVISSSARVNPPPVPSRPIPPLSTSRTSLRVLPNELASIPKFVILTYLLLTYLL